MKNQRIPTPAYQKWVTFGYLTNELPAINITTMWF